MNLYINTQTWTAPKPSQSPIDPPTSDIKLLKLGLSKSVLLTRTVEGNIIVTIVSFRFQSLVVEMILELAVKVLHGIGQSEVS